jgi:hypothetical protein
MAHKVKAYKNPCECSDPGCPVHAGKSDCENAARTLLIRVDMDDSTGTAMCQKCAEDALESGLFYEVPLVRRYATRKTSRRGY